MRAPSFSYHHSLRLCYETEALLRDYVYSKARYSTTYFSFSLRVNMNSIARGMTVQGASILQETKQKISSNTLSLTVTNTTRMAINLVLAK